MDGYSTHQSLLLAAILQSEGRVIELGCGYYSTPLLSVLGEQFMREIITLEELRNKAWLDKFEHLKHKHHKLYATEDIIESLQILLDDETPTGVVFVDHGTESTRAIAAAIALESPCVRFVVCHDTNPDWESSYNYTPVFQKAKHVVHSRWQYPHTAALSNKARLRTAIPMQ